MQRDVFRICTKHLRTSMERAAELAFRFDNRPIEPAHLLLALAETRGSVSAGLLSLAKLDVASLHVFLQQLVGTAQKTKPSASASISQRYLSQAATIAFRARHPYVGTEHLLAVVLETPGPALATFFRRHPWQIDQTREQLDLIFKNNCKLSDLTTAFREDGVEVVESNNGETAPVARNFTINLTSADQDKRLDPLIGREREVERLMQILVRRTKNNPVLLGDPGVGKTAIVEGLAKRIIHGDVPPALKRKKILALDIGSLVAGTMFRGEFENRLKSIIDELKRNPDIILFIDELHVIVGAGAASGSVDAANILKPALARGEIRCIGATTVEEYRQHIEHDGALERRFQPIYVEEPTLDESRVILSGLKPYYESYHGLSIADDAIEAAVTLSGRYLPDRFLPDKAIDLVDEAAARVKLTSEPPAMVRRLEELETAERIAADRKETATGRGVFDEALRWQEEERTVASRKGQLIEELRRHPPVYPTVDRHSIAEILTAWTKVPAHDLILGDEQMLQSLEARIRELFVGHAQAVTVVAETIRRSHLGLSERHRPLASFLCIGPSGVGKTTLARTIAHALFGSDKALLRLDMSEFAEGFTVSKLIGAPAGYVGYRESGLLTERVRRRPYQVILFDELDRAHHDVSQLLLQILDEGSLRDGTGRSVSFAHTIVVATVNPLGTNSLERLGFADKNEKAAEALYRDRLRDALRDRFPAELINRFDATIVLLPLSADDLMDIVRKEMATINERLSTRRVSVTVPESAARALVHQALESGEGARGLERELRQLIESELSSQLLAPQALLGKTLTLRQRQRRWVLVPH